MNALAVGDRLNPQPLASMIPLEHGRGPFGGAPYNVVHRFLAFRRTGVLRRPVSGMTGRNVGADAGIRFSHVSDSGP